MNYKELFTAVLVAMQKEKMKKASLGRLTGINGGTITSWVTGKGTPSRPEQVAAMFKMIDMFKIDVEQFAPNHTVGERLEFLRIKNSLQIEELSVLVPCHRSTINHLEAGDKVPSRLLNNFALVLKTTPEFIAFGVPTETIDIPLVPVPPIRNGLVDVRVDLAGIVAEAKSVGALLYTKDGGLFAGNSSVVSGELRQRLLDNKSALIEFLTPKPLEAPAEPLINGVKEFIEISTRTIGGESVNSVSARELYLDLGLDKSHWARWSKENIEGNMFFTQDVDFIKLATVASAENPNPPQDYAVTIEMATHLAMMAKTQRAHDYRNHFIECEKVAKFAGTNKAIDPTTPEVRQTMWKAREFARLSGASKREADEYVNRITEEKHGIRPIKVVTGERHQQLNLRIVK